MLRWAEFLGGVKAYEVTGTFGDSFAPVIGVLTAFALGASAASTYMQVVEMREARDHEAKQAAAQDRANDLAEEANDLARGAQLVEALRQIAEIDRVALGIVGEKYEAERRYLAEHPGLVGQRRALYQGGPIQEPSVEWNEYWKAPLAHQVTRRGIDSSELRVLAKMRLVLANRLNELEPAPIMAHAEHA